MKGIGTDIIEIKRIKQLNHRERFIHKLLSEEEFRLYQSFQHEKGRMNFQQDVGQPKKLYIKRQDSIVMENHIKTLVL